MRLYELKNNKPTRPIVYVDMDGVLADFFGEVARRHEVARWRDIAKKDIEIDQVASQPHFFANLPKMKNADQLIKGVIDSAGEYSILSSPLLSHSAESIDGKTDWLKKHYNNAPPSGVVFDHEKFHYAVQDGNVPNILIDDYPTNIKLWQAHGGIGILYKEDEVDRVLEELRNALEDPDEYVTLRESPTVGLTESRDLFTNLDVLGYVKGVHYHYSLDNPIKKVKTWQLVHLPTSKLSTPEFYHQDDPYYRTIKLDWDHINQITLRDILTKPAVVDSNGWILDGNHRVTAARLMGLKSIPIIMPAI